MWNRKQLEAIEYRNSSIVLSASAGSGKTAVLVERILRILIDEERKVKADSLIITTFTNDAAAEIRQRLEKSLTEYIIKNPNNNWIKEQRILLKNAKISTMHKVFYDILREYGYKINIQTNFRIANKSEIDNIINQSINFVLNFYCEKFKDKYVYLVEKLCKINDSKIEIILLNILKYSHNIPFFYKKYINNIVNKEYLKENIVTIINNNLIKIENLILEAQEIALTLEVDPKKNPLKAIVSDLEKVNYTRKSFVFDNKFEILRNANDEIKYLRDIYKGKFSSLEQYFNLLGYFEESFDTSDKITKILIEMLFEIEKKILETKIGKNIFYHDDADRLVLELLCDIDENGEVKKSQLCKSISNSLSYIMVDEFQDINDYQFLIFNLLAKEDNFFAVGDMKQAIYRFRGANPIIFKDLQNKNNFQNFYLNCNYRSSKTVIDFVNNLFKTIGSKYFSGFDYTENDWFKVGRDKYLSEFKNEILLYDNDNSEIEIIARRIKELLETKAKIYDKTGSIRECRPMDFCILSRSRTKFNTYVSKLSEYGIGAVCDIKKPFLNSREIASLLDFLKIIDNPLLDREMFSVLFSPVFSFSLDEIIEIKNDEKIYFQLLNSMGNSKISNFIEILTTLRRIAANSSLVELLLSIYDIVNFVEIFDYVSDNYSAKLNLDLFLDIAKKYQKDNFGGLNEFLDYIERVKKISGDIGISSPIATGDCITITTIHGSKGLEYPFVFLIGTDSKFNFDSKIDTFGKNNFLKIKDFNYSKKFGFGFKILNKTNYTQLPNAQFLLIENENEVETRNEEMRLFYVALTRARERLFITTDIKLFSEKPPCCEDAQSMADWLMYYLKLGNQTDCTVLYPKDIPSYDNCYKKYCVENTIDSDVYKKIVKNLSYEYPFSINNFPSRITVTEIKRELEFETPNLFSSEIILNRPKFLSEKKEYLGATKGNIIHKFLQYADLSNDLNVEINELREKNILSDDDIQLLNIKNLEIFYSSNLISRIKKSKIIKREKEFLVDNRSINSDIIPNCYKDSFMMGMIDMYFEEIDGIVLVDYKSDYCKNADELRMKYINQLLLYKSAVELIENKSVKEVLIYSFHLGIEISL